MRYSILLASLAASVVHGHGLITQIIGANCVIMPGLTLTDGTPRNCVVNSCGAQADTGIIRDSEMASGKYGPLGWTQGKGAVNIEAVLKNFMCTGQEPAANHGAAESVGVEDNLGAAAAASRNRALQRREDDRSKYCGHSGGSSFFNLPVIGVLGIGGERTSWPVESRQEDYHCAGKDKGLPTADDDGKIYAIYRQVNQDGAGPMTAAIDPTSCGSDPDAFVGVDILQDVPGSGLSGLSISTNTDYKMIIQMPEDMICKCSMAGVNNICVVRIRNQALAGPFGGSGIVTQSKAKVQQALAYRLRKRMQIGQRKA